MDAGGIAFTHATYEQVQSAADVTLVVVLVTESHAQETLQGDQIDQVLQIVIMRADCRRQALGRLDERLPQPGAHGR